jgi:predicted alpha/beta-hydrolase family hydrolase
VHFSVGYSSLSPILAFQGSMNLNSRVKGFHACISHVFKDSKRKKLVLGGRSMGARAAVIAANEYLKDRDEDEGHSGLDVILVSYPLQGPKDIRDQILIDLDASIRVLFVIGRKDAMCPLDMLNNVRKRMKAQSWLVAVDGLDHGMHGKGEKELGERTGKLAAEWTEEKWGDGDRDRELSLSDVETG